MGKITLDWNKYLEKASEAVAEGIVMLKNDNGALPLAENSEVAVFGRIQLHYYKSGTGSGGMVNVSKVVGITDGLIESGRVRINQELLDIYKKWDEENPYDMGVGWGAEPWSQEEMPLDEDVAERIAEKCETAIAVIGRTAGEEQDNKLIKGSYFLSGGEENMLEIIRKKFKKVIVVLNTSNIIDMGFVKKYSPDAVLYVWQGGMTGGTGAADVLTGKCSPSGKLTDTIAENISDYPSDKYFGDPERSFYAEDIYVGYRYFETFAPEKVVYPFGFGLSYTSFDIKTVRAEYDGKNIHLAVSVKNTGDLSGKEVVQIYFSAPQGKLGKPAKVLCGYEKTKLLSPGEEQIAEFSVNAADLASYDDSGVTGHKNCYVLEKGEYVIFVGSDVRSAEKAFAFVIEDTIIVKQCRQALAPVLPFERMKPEKCGGKFIVKFENTPLSEINEAKRRHDSLPAEIPYTGDRGIKLKDVRDGKNTMDEFIAQLSDRDLACIIRGEGMNSPRVVPGTAAAFGGVTDELAGYGIPAGCCTDGPSGLRLDCGTKAFSLPNGTMLASTFNKSLITELFEFTGMEMTANRIECLLGPGMNIHRHPLNGRNFEYFSEDPYLSGTMAAAQIKGFHKAGVTGTVKHFCGNNQETGRHIIDSVISERALREIYLKGFEIAVKDGNADSIMTTYGAVNGLWTAGSFDLNTEILRNEWGFKGFVMTDWWSHINRRGQPQSSTDFAAMAAAQNDVYMVCSSGSEHDDNTLEALENGDLARSELQRNAANICSFIMKTHAMERLCGEESEIEIINCPEDANRIDPDNVAVHKLDEVLEFCPEDIVTDRGSDYIFMVDVSTFGLYRITVTASSEMGELAQMPVTVFSMGTPFGAFTWNGTGGKPVSFSCKAYFFSRFTTIKLHFAQSGLKIHSLRFELTDDEQPIVNH